MSSKPIKKNQVVWAKLKGYPWWPSWVSSIGPNDSAVVYFLGEYSHASLKLDQVHDFKDNYAVYVKNVNSKNKKLNQAVEIGLRISEGKSTYEEEQNNNNQKTTKDEDEDKIEEEEEINAPSSSEVSNSTLQKKQKKPKSAPTAAATINKRAMNKGQEDEIESEVRPQVEKASLELKETIQEASEKIAKKTKKTAKETTKLAGRSAGTNGKTVAGDALIDEHHDTEPSHSVDNLINSFDHEIDLIDGPADSKKGKNIQNGRNKRAQADSRKQDLHDTVYKKGKQNFADNKSFYSNPVNGQELTSSLQVIIASIQKEQAILGFTIEETIEVQKMCSIFKELNLPTSELMASSVGVHFFTIFEILQKKVEINKEVNALLGDILQSIRNQVISNALGDNYLNYYESQLKLDQGTKENNGIDGKRIEGNDKNNSQEETKKSSDQQLRKKICKRISELLKSDYGLEKAAAQELCVQIERKIKQTFNDLIVYKRYVKGLIRLLKEKQITVQKLEIMTAEELITVLNDHIIQQDLKTIGVPQFERNNTDVAESD